MNQTGVALKRIAVYLEEDEVTDQVSTLKKDYSQPHLPGAEEDDLGLENATFKWNEVAEHVDKDTDKRKLDSGPPSPTESSEADETGTAVGDNLSERGAENADGNGERVFELRDISVRFPPGELTVVTGPTASGKTALLVCYLRIMLFLSFSYFV
jgi:ABC-type multidrug transport system fused ATPase/permease subunit